MKTDQSPDVRETAAWAIAELDLRKAADALADVLANDKDADVRADVIPRVVAALRVETVDRVRQAEIRALLQSGERSESVFKKLLESKDAKTRQLATIRASWSCIANYRPSVSRSRAMRRRTSATFGCSSGSAFFQCSTNRR